MRANDLLEIEERISKLLKEEERKRGERQNMLKKIQESIKERKNLCRQLQQEKQERIDRVNRQREALEKAKQLAEEKENEEIEQKKEELRKKYEKAVENVNALELTLSKDMTETVEKIISMGNQAKASGFNGLAQAVTVHLTEEIRHFIVELKSLSKSIRVDKLVDLVKGLNRSIIMTDSMYNTLEERQNLYVDRFFSALQENFSHHFFGQFETNRLDKPEWYIQYLLNSLAEHDTIFSVLSQVDELESDTDAEDFASLDKQQYYHGLISRIYTEIVFRKLQESIYSDSKQKNELVLHHSEEIAGFQREIHRLYGYKEKPVVSKPDAKSIENMFITKTEKELQKILQKDYIEWNELFMDLLKKIFKQCAALYCILPGGHIVLLETAIKKYLEGLTAFLNTFLYKKDEEQKILVYFIEETSHMEEELLEIETEFGMALGEITILKVPYLDSFKNNMLDILGRVLEEKIETVIRPFSSYRFMEGSEQADALLGLAEAIEVELAVPESPELIAWTKKAIGSLVDEYICEHVLSGQIDGEFDIDKIKKLLESIMEVFGENSMQNIMLPQSEERCKELLEKLR